MEHDAVDVPATGGHGHLQRGRVTTLTGISPDLLTEIPRL
jgi:hypothetical protein